jgi:4-hydroxy 2-oxovalerate aldolase
MKMTSPKILDCTLRDGGYYTNWDFDRKLVKDYITAMSQLPIDYIEVGYRTNELNEYAGEYRYLSKSTLKWVKEIAGPKLKIALMLDEKDVAEDDIQKLIGPVKDYCDMVRMAISPDRLKQAVKLAKLLKQYNVEVGFNIMYMSKVQLTQEIIETINNNKQYIDYFYLVDSYGGVTPDEVIDKVGTVVKNIDTAIGFHGHNNMELGLANSIAAVSCGATIIDATITGMGRGAGNLKTELLLTYCQATFNLKLNYNVLSDVVGAFETLQKQYKWGTNLPYMISGANSLPQKDVMNWMGKKRYSVNAIVQALSNQSNKEVDNVQLPDFKPDYKDFKKIAIIGGGKTVHSNIEQITEFLSLNPDILIIHSSARNLGALLHIPNKQLMCLTGNEGSKLNENSIQSDLSLVNEFIFPPYPREMGTFTPDILKGKSVQLPAIAFINEFHDAPLSISLQIVLDINTTKEIMLFGFDGYLETLNENSQLRDETQFIIDNFNAYSDIKLVSYTPTYYRNLISKSFYSLL